MAFSAWLIGGLFVDGWAHNNDKPESFFTPWYGLFYSGFAATAAWMVRMVRRRLATGRRGLDAVPVGYGLGLVGVGVFALGGVFDMAWHQVFGIEVDLEALLSPSHLILFGGALLVITSPLRAAWARPDGEAPTFREFLPVLLSTTVATATVAFFFSVFSPSLTNAMLTAPYRFIARAYTGETASWMVEEVQLEGYAAILVTTAILAAPILVLARRWDLPFGTMTLLFGVVSTLVAAVESFDMGLTFAAAPIAGLAGDLLVRRLRATAEHPWRIRAVVTAVPVVMWFAYFAVLRLQDDVGWSVELWSGVSVMAGLAGFGLAVLAVPAPLPARTAGRP